jgi:hypothetical protein
MRAPILAKRFGHPPHRSLRQRGIADQHAVEALRRQQAGEQAHAGAGIAAIQHAIGGPQPVDTDAMHDSPRRRRGFDAHAESREDRRGGARVLAFQETLDGRDAIGQRGEHHRAMRDRLVAGDIQRAAQRATGRRYPVEGVAATAHFITSSSAASRRWFSARCRR